MKDAERRHASLHYASPLTGGSPKARRPRRFAIGVAVLLAGLVYVNALDNPFVYDDRRVIVENRSIRPPLNVRALLLQDASRPVVNVSYAIDRALWGPQPLGFHVTSVLLHMLNVALLFELVRRVMGRRLGGFIAAALLAVHPMMTQSVGYISARPELLCTTFFLLALGAARRWMLGGSGWWLAATFASWMLAVASKETAVVFVAVVLLYDYFVLRGTPAERRRRLLGLHLPAIGLAIAAAVGRLAVFLILEHRGEVRIDWGLGLLQLDVFRRFVTMLLLPGGQAIVHELSPVTGWLDLRVLSALAVLAVMGAVAWLARRGQPIVTLGVCWFLLALIPLAVLVLLGRAEPMAEQRVYLASCGLFFAFGALIAHFEQRLRWNERRGARIRFRVVAVAGLTVLSLHTLLRNAVWGQPVMLWSDVVLHSPESWHGNLGLGEALHEAGRHDDAIGAFLVAVRGRPEEPAIYAKFGLCLIEVGDLKTAQSAFKKLRELRPQSPDGTNGLGAIALIRGEPDRARALYEETLVYDPLNVPARLGLAKVEELQGNAGAALRRCEEIRDLAPETPGNDECISRLRARLGGRAPALR
jgi:tetratricopeptide (TPR) repeat protein